MHLCSDITPPTHPMAGQSEQAPPYASTRTSDWLAAAVLIKVWRQHYKLTIHQKFPSVLWQGNYWFEHHTAGLLLIQSVSRLKSFSKRFEKAERSFRASHTAVYLFSIDCFCATITALGWREHSGDLTGQWWTAKQQIQPITRSWKHSEQLRGGRSSCNESRKQPSLKSFQRLSNLLLLFSRVLQFEGC